MVKFSKSLSFGIGAACFSTMLFLSSCSKEDSLVPKPESAVLNEGSNLKTNLIGSGYGLSPASIPITDGPTCQDCLALGWKRFIPGGVWSDDIIQNYPIGTSSLTALWGNPSFPWVKNLAPTRSPGSILTVASYTKSIPQYHERATHAIAKIKHLKPGKKYAVSFQVATSKLSLLGFSTSYAHAAQVAIYDGGNAYCEIDLSGKEAIWVNKTVIFTASNTEAKFDFGALIPKEVNKLYYAHIFVGKDAVQEVN
jgi:hypothetical protein